MHGLACRTSTSLTADATLVTDTGTPICIAYLDSARGHRVHQCDNNSLGWLLELQPDTRNKYILHPRTILRLPQLQAAVQHLKGHDLPSAKPSLKPAKEALKTLENSCRVPNKRPLPTIRTWSHILPSKPPELAKRSAHNHPPWPRAATKPPNRKHG